MSKKRTVSLNRKWKLSKTLADYKQHKQSKRSLGYLKESVARRKSIKKYACKKLKGDHNFELKETKEYSWWDKIAEEYVCSACGKRKLKFIKKTL